MLEVLEFLSRSLIRERSWCRYPATWCSRYSTWLPMAFIPLVWAPRRRSSSAGSTSTRRPSACRCPVRTDRGVQTASYSTVQSTLWRVLATIVSAVPSKTWYRETRPLPRKAARHQDFFDRKMGSTVDERDQSWNKKESSTSPIFPDAETRPTWAFPWHR
ncbi:hypothetical protein EDB87DRAFT_1636512 [Lactarius vividus]|nr:hypothetical protein EDB87DRAFT_1636512 [Lactarius vividus]